MGDFLLGPILSFAEKYATSLLYKTSNTYKAFGSRIDNLFRKFEPKFGAIMQDIIMDTIPKEYQNIMHNFISPGLYKTIEETDELIEENHALKTLKNNYFLENSNFQRISKDLENNLRSFADSYNLQIKNYHESKIIDFNKLLNVNTPKNWTRIILTKTLY